MAAVDEYRAIVRRTLEEYGSFKPARGEVETEVIVDPAERHFELMRVGWDGDRRIHGTVIHIDIIGDRVWIQYDGTSPGVALDLTDAGIPREAIVLGFYPPDVRPETGFAVG